DARNRQHTFYGVTNERLIIVGGLWSRRTRSVNLRTLSNLSLREKRDGSGTIMFGNTYQFNQWFATDSWRDGGRLAAPVFDMIDRAKDVYEIIRQAQKTAA